MEEMIAKVAAGLRVLTVKPDGLLFIPSDNDNYPIWDRKEILGIPVFYTYLSTMPNEYNFYRNQRKRNALYGREK